VDLYFYRDPEEAEKEEQEAREKAAAKEEVPAPYADQWGAEGQVPAVAAPQEMPEVTDWAAESVPVPSVPIQPGAFQPTEDWASEPTKDWSAGAAAPAPAPASQDWSAASTTQPPPAGDWGGTGAQEW